MVACHHHMQCQQLQLPACMCLRGCGMLQFACSSVLQCTLLYMNSEGLCSCTIGSPMLVSSSVAAAPAAAAAGRFAASIRAGSAVAETMMTCKQTRRQN